MPIGKQKDSKKGSENDPPAARSVHWADLLNKRSFPNTCKREVQDRNMESEGWEGRDCCFSYSNHSCWFEVITKSLPWEENCAWHSGGESLGLELPILCLYRDTSSNHGFFRVFSFFSNCSPCSFSPTDASIPLVLMKLGSTLIGENPASSSSNKKQMGLVRILLCSQSILHRIGIARKVIFLFFYFQNKKFYFENKKNAPYVHMWEKEHLHF